MATEYSTGFDKEVLASNEKGHQTSSEEGQVVHQIDDGEGPSFWTRLGVTPESFKRRTLSDKHNQLNQTLKSRHLNMIAIGGSIGAGLFVGSGSALSRGGPAALLIDFGIIGIVSLELQYKCRKADRSR